MPAGDWLPPAKYIRCGRRRKETHMLWTIFVILLVLWLLGLVSSYTLGGFIHRLLVLALVVLLLQLISGRRPVVEGRRRPGPLAVGHLLDVEPAVGSRKLDRERAQCRAAKTEVNQISTE